MAYLALHDLDAMTTAPRAPMATNSGGPAPDADRLSAFEWSVVAIARRDGQGALRGSGRLATMLGAMFRRYNPRLANDRLEALRRVAVAIWRSGGIASLDARRRLLEAGFTPGQFDALIAGIRVAASPIASDSRARSAGWPSGAAN